MLHKLANSCYAVYDEGAASEKNERMWFARFKSSDFNLGDQGRTVDLPPQVKIRLKHRLRLTTLYDA
ncbi:hypothetical protein CEXT_345661 [Caerostris extrusa]|uniref:Mos1 transposase HTH domain-containing protein n=1 Tax=Caerostris extrusa TaxID=172846 RepID=A0AAV4PTL9_CAEEX|nr:hypothetical protein CEXT_345661 [Caerostris extrusa]